MDEGNGDQIRGGAGQAREEAGEQQGGEEVEVRGRGNQVEGQAGGSKGEAEQAADEIQDDIQDAYN